MVSKLDFWGLLERSFFDEIVLINFSLLFTIFMFDWKNLGSTNSFFYYFCREEFRFDAWILDLVCLGIWVWKLVGNILGLEMTFL